jgi:hypothetical protein
MTTNSTFYGSDVLKLHQKQTALQQKDCHLSSVGRESRGQRSVKITQLDFEQTAAQGACTLPEVT